MINIVCFPADTQLFFPELCLGATLFIHELLTYPLDRLAIRTIARAQNITGKSFLNYKETYVIAQQIYDAEKLPGFYNGLKGGLDKLLSSSIPRYYLFHYLYYRFAYDFIIQKSYEPAEDEQYSGYTPETPVVHPLLKYIDISDPKVHLVAGLAIAIGQILSHPINVLKIKIQCEPLGSHSDKQENKGYNEKIKDIIKYHNNSRQIFMRAGFQSRFLYNFIGFFMEASIFQNLLRRKGFQFMNLFENPKSHILSTTQAVCFGAFSSFAATTLLHPLFFYNQRIIMANIQRVDVDNPIKFFQQVFRNEGVNGIFKGYALNLVRNVTRNTLALSVLWMTAAHKNKQRFKE